MPVAPLPIPNDTPPKPRRRSRRRIILLSILLLLAAPFLAYAALAVRFYTGKPNPTHNYYADLNALRDQYTEDQRAWGLYLAMRPRFTSLFGELRLAFDDIAEDQGVNFDDIPNPFDVRPGDPFFALADTAISATTLIDEARYAARRPIIGTPATDRYANDPPASPADFLPPNPDAALRQPLIAQVYTPLAEIRSATNILGFDAHRAIHEGDPDRTVENIREIIRIARHSEREPSIIADLVAIACADIARVTAIEIVDTHPGAFNDQHLETLIQLFLTDAVAAANIDFDHERIMQHDVIQHVYTDDGRGSGRLTSRGIGYLESTRHPAVVQLLAPIAGMLVADRRSQTRMLDEGIESVRRVAADPALNYHKAALRLHRLRHDSPSNRYVISLTFEPDLYKIAETQVQSRTKAQSTATRLALERFKLANNHYPDTLTQLVPTYLPELPADPFNPGHPIKYLLRDNQPILYSVGSNAIDNQATPAPRNADAANLEARFADPAGPSPTALEADWILSPAQN